MPRIQLTDQSRVFANGSAIGVHYGERLLFRFNADTPKQLQETDFSTTGPDSKIIGNYDINPMTRDIELKTNTELPYEFFIETERDTGLPDEVVPRMKIRPKKLFAEVAAEGQLDPTACWAACLAWWSQAMRNRATVAQNVFFLRFSQMWNKDGTINIDKFEKGVKDSADLNMKTEHITPSRLSGVLGKWPIIIGFRAPGGFGHMNVLYGYGKGNKIKAMEPWWPDPGPDGLELMDDGGMYTVDPNFKFTGQLTERDAGYWQKPAPGQTQLIVAYPAEYLDKI